MRNWGEKKPTYRGPMSLHLQLMGSSLCRHLLRLFAWSLPLEIHHFFASSINNEWWHVGMPNPFPRLFNYETFTKKHSLQPEKNVRKFIGVNHLT